MTVTGGKEVGDLTVHNGPNVRISLKDIKQGDKLMIRFDRVLRARAGGAPIGAGQSEQLDSGLHVGYKMAKRVWK
jgi:hypothetical protein